MKPTTIALVTLVLTLAACRHAPVIIAVDEGCEALCRTPCDTTVPAWRPADPDAADAWDTYPEQVTIPLRGRVEQCELHRVSCVQCLDRLKAAGVTR